MVILVYASHVFRLSFVGRSRRSSFDRNEVEVASIDAKKLRSIGLVKLGNTHPERIGLVSIHEAIAMFVYSRA